MSKYLGERVKFTLRIPKHLHTRLVDEAKRINAPVNQLAISMLEVYVDLRAYREARDKIR